jgi:hypothetical protein
MRRSAFLTTDAGEPTFDGVDGRDGTRTSKGTNGRICDGATGPSRGGRVGDLDSDGGDRPYSQRDGPQRGRIDPATGHSYPTWGNPAFRPAGDPRPPERSKVRAEPDDVLCQEGWDAWQRRQRERLRQLNLTSRQVHSHRA